MWRREDCRVSGFDVGCAETYEARRVGYQTGIWKGKRDVLVPFDALDEGVQVRAGAQAIDCSTKLSLLSNALRQPMNRSNIVGNVLTRLAS
jgi:hypothetical protein